MRFQFLTAAILKMTVFWDVTPCSLAEIDHRGLLSEISVSHGGEWMEVVSTSETSVNLHETTLRNIPEDSHLLPMDVFFHK
jgi:hypothetical protein